MKRESLHGILFFFAKHTDYIMKGVDCMITFIIILSIVLAILMVVLTFTFAGGAAFLLIFGDAIVCVLIIMLIVKAINKKK